MQNDWQAAIENARKSGKLIALGGAVMQNGQILAMAVDGQRQKDVDGPVSTDSLWHIGSITKSMTATMIARLIERGEMTWEMTLGDVFANMDMHPDWQNVTLDQLLTHTSGARSNFPLKTLFIWPQTQEELDQARLTAIAKILRKPPAKPPGSTFVYSNVGFTIAGVMAAHITGKSWETLMREEVFTPLGMHSAGFGPPPSTAAAPQPWGHRKVFKIKKMAMNPSNNPDNTPIMGPAGSLHMNLGDMLRYANAHLEGAQGKGDYLKAETFEHLHTAKMDHYGYGWIINDHRNWAGGPSLWHNGSNTMWYAIIAMAPAKNVAFALVTNDGDRKSADKAMNTLIRDFGLRLP